MSKFRDDWTTSAFLKGAWECVGTNTKSVVWKSYQRRFWYQKVLPIPTLSLSYIIVFQGLISLSGLILKTAMSIQSLSQEAQILKWEKRDLLIKTFTLCSSSESLTLAFIQSNGTSSTPDKTVFPSLSKIGIRLFVVRNPERISLRDDIRSVNSCDSSRIYQSRVFNWPCTTILIDKMRFWCLPKIYWTGTIKNLSLNFEVKNGPYKHNIYYIMRFQSVRFYEINTCQSISWLVWAYFSK